jgi:hypothetical protein
MSIIEHRAVIGGGLAALASVGAATRAEAQNFPGKPLRWIIPFAAAGNYDVTSRLVGEAMGRRAQGRGGLAQAGRTGRRGAAKHARRVRSLREGSGSRR